MLLLDTNVVSELRKISSNRANTQVAAWALRTPGEQTFISVVTIFELERGVLLVERRDPSQGRVLRRWLDNQILAGYHRRIIPFGIRTAQRCASLHVPNPKPEYDAMIAATALEHNLTIVTRNVKDFEEMGITLLNPWE
ncbi:MAG: type II toxin-antitoxin system VapC family toxin [Cyanobacteria bacterium P01_D01_bin.1]